MQIEGMKKHTESHPGRASDGIIFNHVASGFDDLVLQLTGF